MRLALGARPRTVVTSLLREAATVVVIGLVIGVAAARAGAQWMQSLLYGLSARDLATTVVACAAVLAAGAVATYLPARRAAAADPAAILRE